MKDSYDLEVLFIDTLASLRELLPFLLTDKDDRLRWIAYPKKAGKIKSDLSRDIIWEFLKEKSFQPVAMVSLTENWSAMRIRHNNFVKKLVREKAEMPDELRKLLDENPECADYFASLSNTNKKEYVRWIATARREKTRISRLAQTKMLLQDKVPNPFASR